MFAPWPTSVLLLGDSYSEGGLYDISEPLAAAGILLVNEATSGKCVWDTSGGLGADTIYNSVAADLAANPTSDAVVICTAGINDILRRAQGANAVTAQNMIDAMTSILDQIKAANKFCVVVAPPFGQYAITGFGGVTDANATAAYAIRTGYIPWLQTYCASLGFVCLDLKFSYVDDGPLDQTANGFIAPYVSDGLHLSAEGINVTTQYILGALRASPKRKAAA